ncbi:hypothetical protein LCGC14_2843090, partial [marine sediment metagenome]
MSKTVFLLQRGLYSDRHVVGIFSTKENVKKYIKFMEDIGKENDEDFTWYDEPY